MLLLPGLYSSSSFACRLGLCWSRCSCSDVVRCLKLFTKVFDGSRLCLGDEGAEGGRGGKLVSPSCVGPISPPSDDRSMPSNSIGLLFGSSSLVLFSSVFALIVSSLGLAFVCRGMAAVCTAVVLEIAPCISYCSQQLAYQAGRRHKGGSMPSPHEMRLPTSGRLCQCAVCKTRRWQSGGRLRAGAGQCGGDV